MNIYILQTAQKILTGGQLDRKEISELIKESAAHPHDLLYWANQIRLHNFGNKVKLCSIVPGRLGGCSQDCAFCAQSSRYKTHIADAGYTGDDDIIAAAEKACKNKVPNFGIVYSGKTISEQELQRLEKLAAVIRSKLPVKLCCGLGIISKQQAHRLKAAGFARYNHNLETSRRFFPQIVSTHSYSERVETIKAAVQAGLGVCAGGIFGLGESDEDRIDMALELRQLGADTVPMNFLHPIPGTPLGDRKPPEPAEILRIIAMYRFILPKAHLKIAGGRVLNLRDMQSWIFYAGATSLMVGDYLTTAGRKIEDDMQMLKDLNLEPILTNEQSSESNRAVK